VAIAIMIIIINNNNNNKVILIVTLIKITDFIFMTIFPEIF
jgi:hypothetical protein